MTDAERVDRRQGPCVVVFTRVYPNAAQPTFGVFVRERMSRVAERLPVVVVAPVPWFPGQGVLRRWRPWYRPPVADCEEQAGMTVYHPRFLCLPGVLKGLDGLFQALGALPTLRRLHRGGQLDLLDAHFIYPDGVAAWIAAWWLGCPYTVTLRGTIVRISRTRVRRFLARRALRHAARVFSVSESLRRVALTMEPQRPVDVVPNGINLALFGPEDQAACRRALGIPEHARVLITVGTLNERKGFHRVIELMPSLDERIGELHYLAVGGGSPDGNDEQRLRALAQELGVAERVHFAGAVAPERLRFYYAAADLFVLPTRFEGWANVFLEAAACGLPTVTTDVGGNAEVIAHDQLGTLVPFGDPDALCRALLEALAQDWDRQVILAHARANAWQSRIPSLVDKLEAAAGADAQGARRPAGKEDPCR
ncbi:MAG: glycosyltransferase [Halorhodospira sp.]